MQTFVMSAGLRKRVELANLLVEKCLTDIAVEVGVWRGDFSFPFYDRWKGKELWLVDPWEKLPDDEYEDIRNRDYTPEDYKHVLNRCSLPWYINNVRILRDRSVPASLNFPAESVDFVYIDANHRYESVVEDIDAWWPAIKPGGILAGHDIYAFGWSGVTSAVAEFAIRKKLQVHVIPGEFDSKTGRATQAGSWYIYKD